ncbi:MAG: hypothetical protein KDE09_06985 [Anaerolineales bacterium]|nr:hypothetical protein [Anaerolineales bacterium]
MTSRRKPSAIQAAILNFLQRCATSSRSSPTFREIMSEIGASSTSVVSYHVTQLETKGYLSKSPKKFGSLRLTA